MTRPSPEEVLGETARLAYHLHWPLDSILDLRRSLKCWLETLERVDRPAL